MMIRISAPLSTHIAFSNRTFKFYNRTNCDQLHNKKICIFLTFSLRFPYEYPRYSSNAPSSVLVFLLLASQGWKKPRFQRNVLRFFMFLKVFWF